jgi:hypothetical protein
MHLPTDVQSWIHRYCQATDPPHEEEQTFQWTPEAEDAFWSLNQPSYIAPMIGYSQPGEVIADFALSHIGVGGMQFQEQEGQEPAQHTALGPYPRLRRTAM